MSSPRLRASLALALVLALTGLVVGETASLALGADSASRLRVATALGVDSPAAIGEEHPVAPASRQSVTSGTRSRVASDGTDYLVLWHQDPRGLNATRVDRSGNVVDREPIVISQAGLNNDASVTFGGGNYLVAWVTDASEVRGARITPGGQMLDPGGFAIAAGTVDAPDLAFDGTNFMAVWQTGSTVVAARIGPSGTVLDPTPRVLSAPGNEIGRPRIAFNGSDHLVTWGVTSGPIGSSYAVQIKPSGDVVAPGVQEIPGVFRAGSPGAVFDGTNWLIGYGASQGDGDLLARRRSPAGAWVGGVITITAAPGAQSALQLVRSGTGVYAVWADYRRTDVEPGDLYGTRIDGSTVINPGGVPLLASDDAEELPAIAAGSGQLLLSFDLGRGVDEPLSAVRLSPAGAVLDPSPFPVSFVTSSQEAPKVAFDGTNHLAVWNDDRRLSGRPEVFAARISPSGESLDLAGLEISYGHENTHVTDVVFDGTNYLVAWSNHFDVYVTVVGTDGTLRSPQPIPVAVDPDLSDAGASLSVDGQNTLVVWGRFDPDSESDQIVGARISRSGTVLDPAPLAIATGAEDEQQATVAFDGTNHLVLYVSRTGSGDDGDVLARRVSPAGAVLDASPLPVATTAEDESSPDLAWSGNTYLAVWERIPNGAGSGRRVMGGRIDRSGQLVAPGVRLSEAEDEQDDPSVASRNGLFLVAWTRRRDADSDVLAVRVRGNGQNLDPSGFLVAESADTPDVATGGDSWTTVYSHGDPTLFNSGRVFSREVAPK
jgi:hypothetical protein